jgi:hypothetical protein
VTSAALIDANASKVLAENVVHVDVSVHRDCPGPKAHKALRGLKGLKVLKVRVVHPDKMPSVVIVDPQPSTAQ